MDKRVLLCSITGTPTGTVPILRAHTEGLLHLAFSIYLFRFNRTELLIQKRSEEKLLWPGAWANTCCSHHREGEELITTATRRLSEEFGFTHPLTQAGAFVYRAEDPGGKGIEHEYDVLLVGDAEEDLHIDPDPQEIAEWKWASVQELQDDMRNHPNTYAPWFCEGLCKIV